MDGIVIGVVWGSIGGGLGLRHVRVMDVVMGVVMDGGRGRGGRGG